MRLSVIIPAYNDVQAVLTCLSSLQAMAGGKVQYHVQDDASPSAMFPAIIPGQVASVSRNARNLGFAGNCNAGAAHALGEVLVFVNQDVQAVYSHSLGWDYALAAAFSERDVGIVGARLLFPNGHVQNAGGVFDAAGQPAHRCLGWSNIQHPDIATPQDVQWTTGALLAIRREAFDALGGFDTVYRMYFEDVDLCLRARDAGWRVRYEPRCTLIHPAGSTGGSVHFAASARTFRKRWLDSGKLKPGTLMPTARYW